MKILYLIYTHGIAGAEKHLLELLPGLKEYGIECEIICTCPPAYYDKVLPYSDRLKEKGIKTQLIVAKRTNVLGVAKKINRYCVSNGITIIHSHLLHSDMIAIAIKFFYNKKILLLSTKHGYKESYFTSNAIGAVKIPHTLYYYLTKFVVNRSDHNLTISKAIAELYFNLKLTRQIMPYVHHGINIDTNTIKEEAVQYRRASPQLVIVGRLTELKGHAYLFEAMTNVIAQFPTVQLLIMGEGEEHQHLEEKAAALGISGHISFLGFQNNPYTFIENSDIIVLPSLYEAFGLVYIEAFALKTPIVAFDVQACNEIVENGQTGILVPAKDSGALANKIIWLLQNPQEMKRLAENGYQRYVDHYTTDRMVKETAAWYRSIIPGAL